MGFYWIPGEPVNAALLLFILQCKKYGIVTACVGGGQGIAGIIENIQ